MRFVNNFLPAEEQIGSITLLKNNIGCIKVANNPKDVIVSGRIGRSGGAPSYSGIS
jgi:hypothetical protein